MNIIKILLLSALTLSAFAEEKFICQEYDRKTETLLNRTVVLTPMGQATEKLNDEGEYEAMQIPYAFELYEGIDIFPKVSAKGTVLTEDVWFSFTSHNQKVGFSMYLDELEESGLSLISDSGEEVAYFVCRF